jgi:hypothetical protein
MHLLICKWKNVPEKIPDWIKNSKGHCSIFPLKRAGQTVNHEWMKFESVDHFLKTLRIWNWAALLQNWSISKIIGAVKNFISFFSFFVQCFDFKFLTCCIFDGWIGIFVIEECISSGSILIYSSTTTWGGFISFSSSLENLARSPRSYLKETLV